MEPLYPWLAPLWQNLSHAMAQDRLPNSIMIESSIGLGESDLVAKVAQAILCSTQQDEGCGFCHSCQLFAAGNHPDLHRLSPLEGKKQISVEQVRELNRFAAESSQLSGKRVMVVELAEQLNTSSSNALLKTLEEPPAQCHFILQTHKKSQLLPTIVSRCQQWIVATPSAQQTADWAEQTRLDVTPLALALYGHAPLLIEQFNKGQADELNALLKLLLSASVVEHHRDIAKLLKDDADAKLEQLSVLLRMALRHQVSPYAELAKVLDPIVSKWPYAALHTVINDLDELRAQLASHPGLNTELLLLKWLTQL